MFITFSLDVLVLFYLVSVSCVRVHVHWSQMNGDAFCVLMNFEWVRSVVKGPL